MIIGARLLTTRPFYVPVWRLVDEKHSEFLRSSSSSTRTAHIDHGKSTLADRLIQRCGGLSDRDERPGFDLMDIEKNGITIKAQTASLHKARDGQIYNPNSD